MIPFRKTMSKLTINSTLRMNSGYEIPMLGYGVRFPTHESHRKMKFLTNFQVYQTYGRNSARFLLITNNSQPSQYLRRSRNESI
jgi:hypothetical protein